MNLNFNEAVEQKEGGAVTLRPGSHDNVFITGFESNEPSGKSPYIEITMVAEDGSGQHKGKLYMSQAAAPYSLAKIKSLMTASNVSVPDAADSSAVGQALIGKKVAIRLYGEEIKLEKENNKIIIKSQFSNFPFCAPAGSVSKLPYDATKAIKRLPESAKPVDNTGDDLPF